MTRYVVYDMGLHCLTISHNKDIMWMWVQCMFTHKQGFKTEYCLSLARGVRIVALSN